MEVSVISNSQVKIGKVDENLGFAVNLGNCNHKMLNRDSRVHFDQSKRSENGKFGAGFTLRAIRTDFIQAELKSGDDDFNLNSSNSVDDISLFVGLPLDAVSKSNKLNQEKAITAGLKALKLMGVDGVELSVWWGIVENEALGQYDWSGYLAVVKLVQKMDLKLRVALNFHSSREHKIPLPEWVQRVGEADPSIYFMDRAGKQYNECLSLAVDELPIFENKTPIQVYEDLCESFKSTFSSFIGSTISEIMVGLGPNGELRYPSCHLATKNNNNSGVGEFQCYDKYMLGHLKQHAEEKGNPMWGRGGPHDVPSYNEPPFANTFFKDNGGSWELPYGDFFLSWYSDLLISHGTRILSLASNVFCESQITISGKLPLLYSWNKTRSHPSELTAGIYNTANRDGYETLVEIFAKYSCKMTIPGMDLSDLHESNRSSLQSLLGHIKDSCKKHGVGVIGENLSLSREAEGFGEIKGNLLEHKAVLESFTYQRMGPDFFSPKHFPLFIAFIHAINQLDLATDDMAETGRAVEAVNMNSHTLQMQAA